jgi:DNA repair exonuclease SbcCD ATPase subunit
MGASGRTWATVRGLPSNRNTILPEKVEKFPMNRPIRLLLILLPVVAGFVGFWLGRTTNKVPQLGGQATTLEEENHALKATIEKLRADNTILRNSPGDTRVPQGGSSRVPQKGEHLYGESVETVRTLQESLTAANQSIAVLQARANELQTQLDQVKQDQARLTALETDLTEQLASSKRQAEIKETELVRKNEQLEQLETTNKKLREEAAGTAQKANQQLQALNELQEIYRRRESYLNTLISRYREITEQYRAFSSVLENRRGPEGTSGSGISIAGPELGRIQNSIAMAEEDLRQLTTLNAQVLRIQKKLPTK